MKIIVHIELSDEARNDLAKRIDRNSNTKRVVTRKEVTELTRALIDDEVRRGWEDDEGNEAEVGGRPGAPADDRRGEDGGRTERVPDEAAPAFVPSRGDEDYIAQPRDPGIAAACSRILDDAALIENFAWETIERNRK